MPQETHLQLLLRKLNADRFANIIPRPLDNRVMLHPLEKPLLRKLQALLVNGVSATEAKQQLNIYNHVKNKELTETCLIMIKEMCENARIEAHKKLPPHLKDPSKRLGH